VPHLWQNNLRARVLESGGGARVALLVPTMFALAETYGQTIDQLVARGFRVITIELPGTGRSAKLREPWNFDQHAAWLARAIEQMQLDSRDVTLIGHSNSAAVVMTLAARHPTLAARHPTLAARIVLEGVVGAMPHPRLPAILMGRALDSMLELRMTFWGMPHVLYNLFHHPLDLLYQLELGVARQAWHLPTITVPTLLALGARDHTIPMRSSLPKLRQLIPRAQLYVSPTGSHDWIITHPAEFAAAVQSFVAGSSPAGGRGA
jgi:pimeloyl-ACP methyl ester carboxylesterase